MTEPSPTGPSDGIAIVGMTGRFPGAPNLEVFWRNVRDGVESISFFSDAELLEAGVAPALLQSPHYVKAGAPLADIEQFDAGFFGFNPREAAATDPQHRLFLECAWEALEYAGYDPATYAGLIGVYAGSGVNPYALGSMAADATQVQTLISGDKDFLTTRVSYKLNLKGPSVAVQTACSTSLVAVQLACQGLQTYQCDMALAGGVSIAFTQKTGYLYQEEGILSPDGHCRAFDAQAQGAVAGDGVGIVALKRLEDALADRDAIYAIIRGAAINNDGAVKVGFTAPSVGGQAEVIAMAQAMAGVDVETITYIEAHGTGTALGDPIEIAALTEAFRAHTQKKGFCAIGSLKTNIGHVNAAAGIAGLIKTVLMMQHRQLPPSLHFTEPNPAIDFANSPFYVNRALADWPTGDTPRRAGVSSFGIGGTNAHVVLEEAAAAPASTASRPHQLLALSARSEAALEAATANLTADLKRAGGEAQHLADVAYTLQTGRRAFSHRRMAVCQGVEEAIDILETGDSKRLVSGSSPVQEGKPADIAFLFPGQGAQYVGMGAELHRCEPVFRDWVDHGAACLEAHLGLDVRGVIYPDDARFPSAGPLSLEQTAMAQPALFLIEYALAQLWMSWGVRPQVMIGHSIGEYTAACLAGVMSLEDALRLVAARGRLMQQLPPGAMLAVALSESETRGLMGDALSLAAVNGPSRCVVSGASEAVAALQRELDARGAPHRRLRTSHAFHSAMMDAILDDFGDQVKTVALHSPKLPYLSNVTGTWITASEVTNPQYWVRHLRHTVRFAEGLDEMLRHSDRMLLEVGPGGGLAPLVPRAVLTSLPTAGQTEPESQCLLQSLGRLWLAGAQVDWAGFYAHEQRRRTPLPTYPFERQSYWIDTSPPNAHAVVDAAAPSTVWNKKPDVADWFYMPSWKRTIATALQPDDPSMTEREARRWLLLVNEHWLSDAVAQRLAQEGQTVITVTASAAFAQYHERAYSVNPASPADYITLLETLRERGPLPDAIAHLWMLTPDDREPLLYQSQPRLEQAQRLGFHSLIGLAQALGREHELDRCQIVVVSNGIHEVSGDEPNLSPEKATVLGPVRVIPQEYPQLRCRNIDLTVSGRADQRDDRLIEQLLDDIRSARNEPVSAYRGRHRWVQTFEAVRLDGALEGRPRMFSFDPLLADGTLAGAPRLRSHGVYLITGGLGGIGLTLAEHLARVAGARLALTGGSSFPEPAEWEVWLATHGDQDRVSRKIRKLQDLEALGADILVLRADVSQPREMQGAVQVATARFGALHGVIHAAGAPGGGVIQRKTREEAEQVLAPKVMGALALDQALEGIPLDFLVYCSSLASAQGIFGQADYIAANAFLDALAHERAARAPGATISINWDTWQEVGMAVETEVPAELAAWRDENLKHGITCREGVEAFHCILGSRLPQVLVSTQDLPTRLAQISAGVAMVSEHPNWAKPMHPRPTLSSDYVAPRNETETQLAALWQELLGVETIGAHDNFMELGGDSLLAILLNTRLREMFHVQLSVQDLFDGPTIAEMAERILRADRQAAQTIEEKLDMLEHLSDEEAQRLLAELRRQH